MIFSILNSYWILLRFLSLNRVYGIDYWWDYFVQQKIQLRRWTDKFENDIQSNVTYQCHQVNGRKISMMAKQKNKMKKKNQTNQSEKIRNANDWNENAEKIKFIQSREGQKKKILQIKQSQSINKPFNQKITLSNSSFLIDQKKPMFFFDTSRCICLLLFHGEYNQWIRSWWQIIIISIIADTFSDYICSFAKNFKT